jgi:putative flavoprotein involved in K+ transport
MSGPKVGQIPFRPGGFFGRLLLTRLLLRVIFHRVLTIRTWLGRKAYPRVTKGSGPLIRVKEADLTALGVERVPRMVGVTDGLPRLEDGRLLEVENVVWCTGFHAGFSWIDLPILEPNGKPRHEGGVVDGQPGLYFVGLHFLFSLSSGMVHGVARDARRIVDAIVARRVQGLRTEDGQRSFARAATM